MKINFYLEKLICFFVQYIGKAFTDYEYTTGIVLVYKEKDVPDWKQNLHFKKSGRVERNHPEMCFIVWKVLFNINMLSINAKEKQASWIKIPQDTALSSQSEEEYTTKYKIHMPLLTN